MGINNLLKCNICNKKMNIKDYYAIKSEFSSEYLRDVDGTNIVVYCLDHFKKKINRLINERFVENYHGHKIYEKDGKYYPYWGCSYYFRDIEDVRERLNNKHIGVMPVE